MKSLIFLCFLAAAVYLVHGHGDHDFPDEPVVHDYTSHEKWFPEAPKSCLSTCHDSCLTLVKPALHVGCMYGCVACCNQK